MPASFDYCVIRVVPRVERQEFINAGVILYCPEKKFLAARMRVDADRLQALWPAVDVGLVRDHLEAVERICAGAEAGGPIARLSARERFHWLSAARSTMIQPSPVHTGVGDALETVLDRLVAQYL